jgi:hypothetical protein
MKDTGQRSADDGTAQRARNRTLVRSLLLPTVFLTVVLLGGLRVSAETRAFVFVAPPLVTLVLAVLLMLLFVRGRLVETRDWLSHSLPALSNVSHTLTLLTLFFASAQAFNSVLPERGLLHWLFSFFFLWTLWNNQFSAFDARRLLRSLAVLFGTAFLLKHLLLAGLYAPEGGWLRRMTGALLEGVSLGTLEAERFAPATGYISFFTLALYVGGLVLVMSSVEATEEARAMKLLRAFARLEPEEQSAVREAIQAEGSAGRKQLEAAEHDDDELTEVQTVIRETPGTP